MQRFTLLAAGARAPALRARLPCSRPFGLRPSVALSARACVFACALTRCSERPDAPGSDSPGASVV